MGVPEFEVDDLAQEAFLAFFRKASAIHPKAERQFVFQAAFRSLVERRRGFVRRREDFEPALEQLAMRGPTPEDELSQREALALLDELLATMPLELRMVFNLCELEQMAVREAAEILEVPLGTATSRLRRARELFEKLASRVRASETRGGRR